MNENRQKNRCFKIEEVDSKSAKAGYDKYIGLSIHAAPSFLVKRLPN